MNLNGLKMRSAVVVVNPIAGSSDKLGVVELLAQFARENAWTLYTFETTGDAIKDHAAILDLCQRYSPERVLAIGGDGTIKLVAEALLNYPCTLGIIPAGSANGLASDFGLPSTLDEQLFWAFNGEPRAFDALLLNNHLSLHLSDVGLNAQLIRNFEKGNVRGVWGYALQSVTTLIEQDDPFELFLSIDDKQVQHTAQMVIMANSKGYGTGVIVNPDGQMDDGWFELIILTKTDLVTIGKIAVGLLPTETGEVIIYRCQKAKLQTSRPVPFQVDGEFVGDVSSIEMKILPQQIVISLHSVSDL